MKSILLNDASVLLNLLASGQFEMIAGAGHWQFAICPAVRDEVKALRDPGTGEMAPVEISSYFKSGLLILTELSGADEQSLYIEHAALVDDGEAMSMAIAGSRGFELAIDDRAASNVVRKRFPRMVLWTTPEILRRWSESAAVPNEVLRNALIAIEQRARYIPPKGHALAAWWRGLVSG